MLYVTWAFLKAMYAVIMFLFLYNQVGSTVCLYHQTIILMKAKLNKRDIKL